MSSEAIERWAAQLEMDGVVRFHERVDCIYAAEADMLKLFRPQSIRRIGGRSGDRVLNGDIGFVAKAELLLPGRRRAPPRPHSLTLCSLMNLPSIVPHSEIGEEGLSAGFIARLRRYLRALPNTLEDVESCFGSDFLSLAPLERVPIVANFLRAIPELAD